MQHAPAPDLDTVFAALPTAYLVVDRDLVIVEVNRAYATMLSRRREDLVGRPVFEAFPPPPDTLDDDGSNPAEVSMRRALAGETDVLPTLHYDVVSPATGELVQRHWSVVNAPLADADGVVRYVLHRVEDITDYVLERARSVQVEAELFVRDREVEVARRAERLAARTVAAQAHVALQLVEAGDHDELLEGVRTFARSVLGAATASAALLGERPPGSAAAEVTAAGCPSLVQTPVVVDGVQLGELALGWDHPRTLGAGDHEVVGAVAVQYGQAVLRLRHRAAEQEAAETALAMSETLQRSLLPRPTAVAGLDVAVRYRPASQQARVGGDWYDVFHDADGTAALTIGDVSGHDGTAAALMGQVRSLLRGVAYATPADPGHLLGVLDEALFDLGVDALATAVLVSVHPDGRGGRCLRWSNAGHPPPLLLLPDGSVEVLAREPELLLGCRTGTGRSTHRRDLPDGATVVLYTDGLVERRGATIDDGVQWLRERVAALAGDDPEELCDGLLADLGVPEDDVALLLARAVPAGSRPVAGLVLTGSA